MKERIPSEGRKEGEEEEEGRKKELQRQVEVAITAAHQLWKKQQEEKVRALLMQARKEWTEQHRADRDVGSPCLLIVIISSHLLTSALREIWVAPVH